MRTAMWLRTTASVVLATSAASGLAACGGSGSDNSASGTGGGSGGGGTYTVGVTWSALQTPYFIGLKQGLDAAAKQAQGIKLIEVQANNDSSQQLDQIQQLETQGIDLLVVNAVDAATIGGGIKEAASSGIPVVTSDRPVPSAGSAVKTHVGASAEQAGFKEAQAVCKARGRNATYLGIWGLPGNQTTRDRVAGVKRGAKANGCALRLLDEKYEQGETTEAAATTTANWLQRYGPGQVDAIITYADSQAAGALQELKAQNRSDVVVTGAANFGPFHRAICKGDPQALATVDFDVKGQGKTLLETIEKIRDGQPVPKFVKTHEDLVTSKNRVTCGAS